MFTNARLRCVHYVNWNFHNSDGVRRMRYLQWMIAGAAILMFLWFLVPIVAGGKIHIGNVTGFVAAGMLFLYGIRMESLQVFLTHIWNHREGRIILSVLLTVAGIILFLVIAETVLMIRAAGKYPEKPVTAVILGCSVKGSRPCTILVERMDAAAEYLKKNPEAQAVLSGGKGEGEDISEAECMFRYLTAKGIAPERLLKEDRSTSTKENLAFTREIMRARGMKPEIAVITSEFHAYRGAMFASDAGFLAHSVPARTFWLYFPAYYVRELYGILYYWLFCRNRKR